MKYLIDAQLPPLMASVLRDLGHDARHVSELGWLTSTDNELWLAALSDDWVIVSKDEDFAERSAREALSPKIVWIRWGNLRNPALLDNVRAVWEKIADKLESGETLVEAR